MGNLHDMVIYDSKDQEDLFFKLSVHGIIALFSYDKLLITHENEVLRLVCYVTVFEYVIWI